MANRGNVVLYLDKELVEQSRALLQSQQNIRKSLKQLISRLSSNKNLQENQHLENGLLGGPDTTLLYIAVNQEWPPAVFLKLKIAFLFLNCMISQDLLVLLEN